MKYITIELNLNMVENQRGFYIPYFDINRSNMPSELAEFQAPYLEEKLLDEKKFDTQSEYRLHFDEFKKYVDLRNEIGKNLAMISRGVDDVWHQFILFTKQYHDFSDRFLGSYLHHSPNTKNTPMDSKSVSNFITAYQKKYGELSKEVYRSKLEALCSCGSCD